MVGTSNSLQSIHLFWYIRSWNTKFELYSVFLPVNADFMNWDLLTWLHIHSDLVDDLLSFITDVVGEQVITVPHQFEHLIMVLGPLCRVLQEEWRSILNIWFVYKYLQLLSWLKIHGISYYGIIQIPGDKFSWYHFLRLIWCSFIDLVSFIKNKNYF